MMARTAYRTRGFGGRELIVTPEQLREGFDIQPPRPRGRARCTNIATQQRLDHSAHRCPPPTLARLVRFDELEIALGHKRVPAALPLDDRPADASTTPDDVHDLLLLERHLRRALRLERV